MPVQIEDVTDKLRSLLRRVIRQSAPTRPLSISDPDPRLHLRYSRVLPALVVPVTDDDVPSVDRALFFISRDVSDNGISLIHDQDLPCERMIIGLCCARRLGPSRKRDDPILVLGKRCASTSIGGGFWQTGIEFKRLYVDQGHLGELRKLAETLLPPTEDFEEEELAIN